MALIYLGFMNEGELLNDFLRWAQTFNHHTFVGPDSRFESRKLNISIYDLDLSEWSERVKH